MTKGINKKVSTNPPDMVDLRIARKLKLAATSLYEVADRKLYTFKEYQASQDPSDDNLIMHAMLETENGMTLMASDPQGWMEYRPGTNFSVSLSGDNEAELTTYFQKLSEGGTVTMPLTKAPWGDSFGMCTDKFGVSWLVNISPTSTG